MSLHLKETGIPVDGLECEIHLRVFGMDVEHYTVARIGWDMANAIDMTGQVKWKANHPTFEVCDVCKKRRTKPCRDIETMQERARTFGKSDCATWVIKLGGMKRTKPATGEGDGLGGSS